MTLVKKSFTAVIIAALLALFSLSFVACSSDEQSTEEQIRSGISDLFEPYKNVDESTIDDLVNSSDGSLTSYLDAYNIDIADYYKEYFSGFDYRIDDITLNDDDTEATVTLVLTCKSYSQLNEDLVAETVKLATDSSYLSLSEEEQYAKAGEVIMDTLKACPVAETDPITINLTLNDGTWKATAESQAAIATALMTN